MIFYYNYFFFFWISFSNYSLHTYIFFQFLFIIFFSNFVKFLNFFRSHEQQHYFNTPFQLSLPPSELATEVLSDAPESADRYEFSVEDGDVILLATDGVFDNIPDSVLQEEIRSLQSGSSAPDAAKIQVILEKHEK